MSVKEIGKLRTHEVVEKAQKESLCHNRSPNLFNMDQII